MEKFSVYRMITERIIEQLKKGDIPWRKPWKGGMLGIPRNSEGVPYKGVNLFLLNGSGYRYPFWFGFGKLKELGVRIKPEEYLKHRIGIFYKIYPKEEKEGVKKAGFLLRYFKVWNYDQCEPFPLPAPLQKLVDEESTKEIKHDKKEECEKIVRNYNGSPRIRFGSDRACYRPGEDIVDMPEMGNFDSVDEYYSTLFHELAHSTGHHSRLARAGVCAPAFGSEPYAQEELVAEFSATFLCGIAGIEQATLENSAAYIASWIKKLESKPQMLVQAGQTASKAVNFIQGVKEPNYESVESTIHQ